MLRAHKVGKYGISAIAAGIARIAPLGTGGFFNVLYKVVILYGGVAVHIAVAAFAGMRGVSSLGTGCLGDDGRIGMGYFIGIRIPIIIPAGTNMQYVSPVVMRGRYHPLHVFVNVLRLGPGRIIAGGNTNGCNGRRKYAQKREKYSLFRDCSVCSVCSLHCTTPPTDIFGFYSRLAGSDIFSIVLYQKSTVVSTGKFCERFI